MNWPTDLPLSARIARCEETAAFLRDAGSPIAAAAVEALARSYRNAMEHTR